MKAEYQNAIDTAVSRIFSVGNVNDIEKIAKPGQPKKQIFEERDVYRMLEDYNSSGKIISNVEGVYCALCDKIRTAEAAIDRLQYNNTSTDDITLLEDLLHMLQYKIQVLNSIEHIHIRYLQERNKDYEKLLKAFLLI